MVPSPGSTNSVGPDGWNIAEATSSAKLRPATVIRLRYIVTASREQAMGLSLGRRSVTFREELQATVSGM
ncbi:hypothetical protein ETB97_005487 [Aspergillus alliaceus]|uniref:Uncharacterized protein n=1 Tax=Petromyces alliaceus TaxID=209559 RepID=A0A8H5ZYJ9_PETAA|nr:hypothetical protein ETB97_005487 [Aspergillus burnettii]